MARLDGKVAVVTGAGSGLGRAAAQVFASRGATVLCGDISGAEQDTARAIGRAARGLHCDVTNEDQVAAILHAAVEEFGRLDAVLNVAGVPYFGALADLAMSDYDRVLDIDLRGVVHGTKHAAKIMSAAGGGVILNWSSIAALGAGRATSIYSAAKAGVIAITKAAAVEYGGFGVRANAIVPGLFITEAAEQAPKEMIDQIVAGVPAGRGGDPAECAELAAFLASDQARYINGAVVVIDGGQSAKLA